jgi:hypothetical protein
MPTEKIVPGPYYWDADRGVMVPMIEYLKTCATQFAAGEIYRLGINDEVSEKSRRQYFALIKVAWSNLPEDISPKFANFQQLRKEALRECGYFTTEIYEIESERDLLTVSKLIKARMNDDGSIDVKIVGKNIILKIVESQSAKSMGRKRFQKSKQDVLEYVSALIGVTLDQLKENAGRAA